MLGLCACPCLTSLQLDSNGSSIGVAGAQGLAPLSQLQALLAPAQSLGDEGLRVSCCWCCCLHNWLPLWRTLQLRGGGNFAHSRGWLP